MPALRLHQRISWVRCQNCKRFVNASYSAGNDLVLLQIKPFVQHVGLNIGVGVAPQKHEWPHIPLQNTITAAIECAASMS